MKGSVKRSVEQDKTIASLGEFQLIQRFFSPTWQTLPSGINLGPGDDAAVVSIPRTQQLVTTTDTLVEGVHFTPDSDPYLLGQKALRTNLSDMAAMGGQPRWYMLSLSLPSTTPIQWVESFSKGLRTAEQQFNTDLIGGNTTSNQSSIVISLTLMGWVVKDRSILRSGAKEGDILCVSGTIGDSSLGLKLQLKQTSLDSADDQKTVLDRHTLPEPRVALGLLLRDTGLARSAIDISDGLLADLTHLCQASGVGAHIMAEKIPLSPAAQRWSNNQTTALSQLMSGGEDYELLFTIDPTVRSQLQAVSEECKTPITEIGRIIASPDIIVTHFGKTMTHNIDGWVHF